MRFPQRLTAQKVTAVQHARGDLLRQITTWAVNAKSDGPRQLQTGASGRTTDESRARFRNHFRKLKRTPGGRKQEAKVAERLLLSLEVPAHAGS